MKVWNKLVNILDQGEFRYEWESIVLKVCSMKCNKNIGSIVRRLVLDACAYHIWQERNERLFTDGQRSWMDLIKVIANEVRFKMLSLKVKQSKQVNDIENKWKVQMNVQPGDETIIDENNI